ncbi:MAG: hypothetical protein CMP59_07145 [Flavobacteriales bacterium]|nr:hypothetical protein [Flavobacteriales bacterium]
MNFPHIFKRGCKCNNNFYSATFFLKNFQKIFAATFMNLPIKNFGTANVELKFILKHFSEKNIFKKLSPLFHRTSLQKIGTTKLVKIK